MDVTIGLTVGSKEPVELSVNRVDGIGYLVTLLDQLPGVLADLGVLGVADERAVAAGSRAEELAEYLNDQAETAEQAGQFERAGELRRMAGKLTAVTNTLESALTALGEAAHAADDAAEDAKHLLDQQVAKRQPASEGVGQ